MRDRLRFRTLQQRYALTAAPPAVAPAPKPVRTATDGVQLRRELLRAGVLHEQREALSPAVAAPIAVELDGVGLAAAASEIFETFRRDAAALARIEAQSDARIARGIAALRGRHGVQEAA
jgi:hypothetical protein